MTMLNKLSAMASMGDSPKRKDHRVFGRARADAVECDRGRVLDISRTGMRLIVWRPWREGRRRMIMLSGINVGVTVPARCIWSKRLSRFRHVMGLEFEGLDETTEAVIKELMHLAMPHLSSDWANRKTDVDKILDGSGSIDEQPRKSA